MIKIVPDPPPAGTILKTVTTPFGSCDAGHEPLFAVRGGINAEDALVHASLLLRCATDTAYAASECPGVHEKGLMWSTMHSIEMAKAIVDALVDGAEGMSPRHEPESRL
ncbi:DUF3077 domain-containing protein [Pseudomonas sp. LS1212]|uniref:DUF3077 domain-containing protein n=1 Tax=Pseudomonas sp. LS1212 TaxID=2972478 RepID=UPI00215D0762|nr:DUF3077 domain-containing protein [Pseudomonas sp. LS1212]UVJ45646.1 DUF3077 domain-containing protein [Pseudomonas sp. LS1212]